MGQPAGNLVHARGAHGGELGDVPDGDAPAPAVLLGEIADQHCVELLGRGAAVEMHVDVDVEFAPHLEDAADLSGPVRVVVGRGADHGGAALEGGDHQLVGAGIV